jgi:hypoxanthine phosphoribosyltransferase
MPPVGRIQPGKVGRVNSRRAGTLIQVPETLEPIITEQQITDRVAELAAQIDADHAGADELVLVGVLKGSFVFLADLARRVTVPRRIEFLAVSSYGDREAEESGAVRLIMDVRHDIADKPVIVVEDIVDTGHTLAYLLRLLEARGPSSLQAITLLRKPDRAEVDVPVDYVGFDIPDVWVVGYGLDFAERHRTLPDICALRRD